jgi:macrolide transport system ATP-binding/permease protein
MKKLIELKNICRDFPSGDGLVRVLDNVSLEINEGEFIAIIGSSGSGKSTLMNILGCLDKPTSGDYLIENKPVKDLGKDELAQLRREHFGFIFQRYHLINSITARSNVEVPSIYAGVDKETRKQRALTILNSLGIGDKALQKPSQLSGGQQQRVSIARALMNGGQIILADEPTGALDSKNGVQVMALLKNLHKDGHTIIIVTHDPGIAKQANRVIEIADGKIISNSYSEEKKEYFISQKKEIKKAKVNALSMFSNQFREAFSMATNAILNHKIRSFLTMLGIIIGIASVVSVVALGEGSKVKILNDINSMGSNMIDVYPGSGWGDRKAAQIKTLSERDVALLKQQPYVDSVSPNVSGSRNITYKELEVAAQVMGVGEDYFRVKAFDFSQGRNFSEADIKTQAQSVVIDSNTLKKLFPNDSPIGKVIFVGNVPLKVTGVLEEKKSGFGNSENLQLFIPYTTAMHRLLGVKNLGSITIRVKDGVDTQLAENGIISIITRSHGGKKDFYTNNLDSIKQTVEQTTATLTLLISAIAIISLVVGGIGVMNIMLVSVTERTKEIGIRMAIGARESDIMQQFLIEAVLVCLIGGVLGITLALSIGYAFNSISTSFSMIFSTSSIVTAFVCSSAIGIIFGFIPAKNAAKLDPIVALVQE